MTKEEYLFAFPTHKSILDESQDRILFYGFTPMEEVQKKVIQKRIPGIFEPTPNLFGRTTTEEIPLITKPFKDVHTGTLVKIISKR